MTSSLWALTPECRAWLALLDPPTGQEQFIRRCAEAGIAREVAAEAWACLQRDGWLHAVPATQQPQRLASSFGQWRSQRGMLADATRTDMLRRAIEETVRPSDVVVDVGTGSGILALFSARAGAGHVFALESTTIAEHAEAIAGANGFADRITVIRGDAAHFERADVDLVLGEFAGMWLVEEWRHFEAFVAVRNRCLKPGGRVLPRRARLFLGPIDDSSLYVERGPGWWTRPVWGFDFSLVHENQWDRTRRIIVRAHARTMLDRWQLAEVDFATGTLDDYFQAKAFTFEPAHAGSCHGLLGWFELDLAPGLVLDTSPLSGDTSWHQSYFPFDALAFDAGDVIHLEVRMVRDETSGDPVLCVDVEQTRGQNRVATRMMRYTLQDTQG